MKDFNPSYVGIRKDLLRYVTGDKLVVLDVGCANGKNGKYLIENNIADQVYGIEFDLKMASEAKVSNTKIFLGDLNDRIFINRILDETPLFDYILFGDILEHLYDPWYVLSELKSKLKDNGRIIISLPNIGHIELFIQVFMNGTWPRNDRGIFDKTHIRWFTRKDVFSLLECSKLELITYERKFRSRDAKGSKFNWKTKFLKFISKDLVTFQHIVVCKNA